MRVFVVLVVLNVCKGKAITNTASLGSACKLSIQGAFVFWLLKWLMQMAHAITECNTIQILELLKQRRVVQINTTLVGVAQACCTARSVGQAT